MKKLIVCLALGALICAFCGLPALAQEYGFVAKWGGFNNPCDVAVDSSSGNVYVAEMNSFRIQKFDSSGGFITQWGGTGGSGDGQFYYPRGVTVDPSGNVYVVDTGNRRIQKFTSSGIFITKWGGTYGSENGQFKNPSGVAVDSSGRNVYVADSENHCIQKFSTTDGINYNFITKWGTYGQFKNPEGVAVDPSGNVYVADTNNHCIQKFTSSGVFITKWGTYGSGNGQFYQPFDVAVDSSGNVYVGDTDNHRIQKFTSSGVFITKWGSEGSGDGQFRYPYGVAVDSSSGYVYVADYINQRIQKFALVNTPTGTNVKVSVDGITTGFLNVTAAGVTTVTVKETGPAIPGNFKLLGKYYDISTGATYSGPITISIPYDDAGLTPAREQRLKLQHYVDGRWVDITKSIDTTNNIIIGETNHLSYFAVMESLNRPPVADAGVDQTVSAQTTAFTATAVLDGSASYDPDPEPDHIVEYKWDLGDGSTADGVTVSHQYTALGTYNVTLTVKDTYGETNTATCVVTVNLRAVTPSGEPDKILIPMPTAAGELPPGLDQDAKIIYLTREEFQQYHPVSQGKSPKTGKGFEVYQK